jgi:hypothetical protein
MPIKAAKEDPGGPAEAAAFRQALGRVGRVAGHNIKIELHCARSNIERLGALAQLA